MEKGIYMLVLMFMLMDVDIDAGIYVDVYQVILGPECCG
jgi:hypothetical protein